MTHRVTYSNLVHNDVGGWQVQPGLVPPGASSNARAAKRNAVFICIGRGLIRVIRRNEPSREPVRHLLVEDTAGPKSHEGGVDNYCQGMSITAGRPLCLESGSHRSLGIFCFMGLLLPQIRGIGVFPPVHYAATSFRPIPHLVSKSLCFLAFIWYITTSAACTRASILSPSRG